MKSDELPFELASRAASAASPMPIDVSGLGQFPILQFFGGLMVLAFGVLMFLRGQKDKQAIPPPAPLPEFQVHMQGPLIQGLGCLQEIAQSMKEIISMLHRVEEQQLKAASELEIERKVQEAIRERQGRK